jgi:putative transposase
MPRASRHYLPGYVWHLTHRCHREQFLLRFAKDRRAWVRWLYAARQRYGLCVLDYAVTSNHIHLVVRDQGRGEIARSMQLIAGRTGQAYNQRKNRNGAFWEDRYHATAVETGAHLARCLVYVDLNMVRAGVVPHPAGWESAGHREIQSPPHRGFQQRPADLGLAADDHQKAHPERRRTDGGERR